jgi:AcrR family transcriptional regulator
MARPITISDEKILAAARAELTEKGIGATTAAVAARAGVSEGILFKRFGSKDALFRAATNTAGEVLDIIDQLKHAGPLRTRADFERLIQLLLEKLRLIVPMVILAWSSKPEGAPMPPELAGDTPRPLVALHAMTEFFAGEIKAGNIRRRNPEIAARALIGSVWHFIFMEVVLRERNAGLSSEAFTKELAKFLFDALHPTKKGEST